MEQQEQPITDPYQEKKESASVAAPSFEPVAPSFEPAAVPNPLPPPPVNNPIHFNLNVGQGQNIGQQPIQAQQPIQEDYKTPESPQPVLKKPKKGAIISSSQDKVVLVEEYNKLYETIIVSYLQSLTTTYKPEIREQQDGKNLVQNLQTYLENKFTSDVEGKTIKGMKKTIRSYLNSLKHTFECIHGKYKKSHAYSLGNPALLTRQFNTFIKKIMNETAGNAVLMNNKTVKKYCEEITEQIKHDVGGGTRRRIRRRSVRSTKKRRRAKTSSTLRRSRRHRRK
jgi:hypothetical protein